MMLYLGLKELTYILFMFTHCSLLTPILHFIFTAIATGNLASRNRQYSTERNYRVNE